MNQSESVCVHFRVRGQVQGVYFRASTEEMAQQLGITGWVRNDDNGDVVIVACAMAVQLEAFGQWLELGPPAARVTDVLRTPAAFQTFEGFEVRR